MRQRAASRRTYDSCLQRPLTMSGVLPDGGRPMKRSVYGLVFALLATLGGARLLAQVDRATISGLVTDSNGGALPGATVAVTSLATGVESREQTSDTGA